MEIETPFGNLFVGDIITPGQFYDSRKDDSAIRPVKRLMMAVLEDGVRCYLEKADARNRRDKRLFEEAEEWLFGEGVEGPFSFETVCETLGIDPNFLRQGLKELQTRKAAGLASGRLARRSPVRTSRLRIPEIAESESA